MGIVNHHAVIATTSSKHTYSDIVTWIANLEFEKSILGEDFKKLFVYGGKGVVNYYYTIALLPDGSKEGWEDSHLGDKLRQLFINKLNEDDSWRWAEVSYGEFGQHVKGNNKTYEELEKEELKNEDDKDAEQ